MSTEMGKETLKDISERVLRLSPPSVLYTTDV